MRKTSQIVIELTPLLDVIMIILFLILSESQNNTEQIIKETNDTINVQESIISQLQDDVNASNEELELARGKLAAYEFFNEYADIVTIRVINTDVDSRKIVINGKDANETIEFNWDNMTYAENAFKGIIDQYNNSTTPIFITLSYNSETMFKQDYDFIINILQKVDNDLIYIKYDAS